MTEEEDAALYEDAEAINVSSDEEAEESSEAELGERRDLLRSLN